jgi:hypothetical protein
MGQREEVSSTFHKQYCAARHGNDLRQTNRNGLLEMHDGTRSGHCEKLAGDFLHKDAYPDFRMAADEEVEVCKAGPYYIVLYVRLSSRLHKPR